MRFSKVTIQSHTRCSDAAISNATICAKIRYGNSAHVDDGCKLAYSAFRIAAKLLQIKTWLLLTAYAYSYSSLSYQTVAHLYMTYGLDITRVTDDRQTTHRIQLGLT